MRKRAAGESFMLELTLKNGDMFYREFPTRDVAVQKFRKTKAELVDKYPDIFTGAAVIYHPANALSQAQTIETTAVVRELRENLPKGEDRRKSEHMARLDKGREVPNAPEKKVVEKQKA